MVVMVRSRWGWCGTLSFRRTGLRLDSLRIAWRIARAQVGTRSIAGCVRRWIFRFCGLSPSPWFGLWMYGWLAIWFRRVAVPPDDEPSWLIGKDPRFTLPRDPPTIGAALNGIAVVVATVVVAFLARSVSTHAGPSTFSHGDLSPFGV